MIYHGTDDLVKQMKEDFIGCEYYRNLNIDDALESVFGEDPIRWLEDKSGALTAASLHAIYMKILSHLPHYEEKPDDLAKGLSVPGEVSRNSRFVSRLKFLTCEANITSINIVEELKNTQPSEKMHLIENHVLMIQQSSYEAEESSLITTDSIMKNPTNDGHDADNETENLDPLLRGDKYDLYDLTTNTKMSIGSIRRGREIYLLYLCNEVLTGCNKEVLRKVLKKIINERDVKILIVHGIDDTRSINFYWRELTQLSFDNKSHRMIAVPFISTCPHYHQVSLRLILNTALNM